MTPIPPIEGSLPIGAASLPVLQSTRSAPASFSSLLVNGVEGANTKMLEAEETVRAFALDDSIPVHQVTYALEKARLSLEMVLQVRSRMVEAYQQFMNMQL